MSAEWESFPGKLMPDISVGLRGQTDEAGSITGYVKSESVSLPVLIPRVLPLKYSTY